MTIAPDRRPLLPLEPDDVTVPAGCTWYPVIRWGDPLFPGVPPLDLENQSAEAQAGQFGYHCDQLDVIADPGGCTGVLATNHEYVSPGIMFAPSTDPAELDERAAIARAAHGFSVVELERAGRAEPWTYVVGARRNRRITADTMFEATGPAAGSDLLRTAQDPQGRWIKGTLGNGAGGTTPWGTVLSGEENFDGYFVWAADTPGQRRIRSSASTASTYTFERIDPRFNARTPEFVNEPHRFGWIVEIDPQNPTSVPKKHTALGRFKHEGADVVVGEDGRAVVYMGDDQAGDHLYRFVSKNRVSDSREKNLELLSEGDLYVARFTGDSPAEGASEGSGEWVPLTKEGRSVVPGFSAAEVLVHTRLAADAVGATALDRPEDVRPHPTTGTVDVTLTNGHVLELAETAGRAGTRFAWNVLRRCGDRTVAVDDGLYLDVLAGPRPTVIQVFRETADRDSRRGS